MQGIIPTDFKRYFWDTDINKLSIEKNRNYIIERLLELGDIRELKWLKETYPKKDIIDTLKSSTRISPKTGNFFALYYQVSRDTLVCMKKRFW